MIIYLSVSKSMSRPSVKQVENVHAVAQVFFILIIVLDVKFILEFVGVSGTRV